MKLWGQFYTQNKTVFELRFLYCQVLTVQSLNWVNKTKPVFLSLLVFHFEEDKNGIVYDLKRIRPS